MLTNALGEKAFDELESALQELDLAADATCNLFPSHLKLLGPWADKGLIAAYLDQAFERMARLGTYKVVFGSSGARDLPLGMSREEGMEQLVELLIHRMVPKLQRYGIQLVMEPISQQEANFITSLPEGMAVVEKVGSPHVTLLADSVHMLRDQEDMEHLNRYYPYLDHIHISELGRRLPTASYSAGLEKFLQKLKQRGYSKTVSFEPVPCPEPQGPAKALRLLRWVFEGEGAKG